jgi:hypothetical protein
MNKLDPRVDANPTTETTGQTSTLPSRGVGSGSEGFRDPTIHHDDRHFGEDAALAGSIGGAAYETDKHHKHDKDLTQAERDAKREHKHELKEEKREHKDHHLGRDAAVAGGVGGAAYEADKHHRKNQLNDPNTLGNTRDSTITGQPTTTSGATTTAGPHSSNLANKADPTVDSDRSKDHHYGRDAAIAGGVGGAAYEADKHHKHDKDLTQAERDTKKEHKHELKEEKKDHKGGLFGFLRMFPSISSAHLRFQLTTYQTETRTRNTPQKKRLSLTAKSANTIPTRNEMQPLEVQLEREREHYTSPTSIDMLVRQQIPTSHFQPHQETTVSVPEPELRMLLPVITRPLVTTTAEMQHSEPVPSAQQV